MSSSPAVVVNVYEQGPDLSELLDKVTSLFSRANTQLVTTVTQLLSQQGDNFMAVLDDLQAAVAALQAEDGVVVAGLNDLKAKLDAGTLQASDIQAVTDSITGEVANLSAAVDAVGETPAPPAPAVDPNA